MIPDRAVLREIFARRANVIVQQAAGGRVWGDYIRVNIDTGEAQVTRSDACAWNERLWEIPSKGVTRGWLMRCWDRASDDYQLELAEGEGRR